MLCSFVWLDMIKFETLSFLDVPRLIYVPDLNFQGCFGAMHEIWTHFPHFDLT